MYVCLMTRPFSHTKLPPHNWFKISMDSHFNLSFCLFDLEFWLYMDGWAVMFVWWLFSHTKLLPNTSELIQNIYGFAFQFVNGWKFMKIIFCFGNCSDILWYKIVLLIKKKGREFAKKFLNHEQFIQTVLKHYTF